MKTWKVDAELNMDANNRKTIIIRANTERKARIFAEKQFIEEGAFWVSNMIIEEQQEYSGKQ